MEGNKPPPEPDPPLAASSAIHVFKSSLFLICSPVNLDSGFSYTISHAQGSDIRGVQFHLRKSDTSLLLSYALILDNITEYGSDVPARGAPRCGPKSDKGYSRTSRNEKEVGKLGFRSDAI
ncbi:MAG: hypothetical protein M1834_005687 [Cirrosporium novae-zelandiae]|nr:MAG: hypothetical protein M1834_005687 [Cirrosporium novae-zelandiae]